MMVAVGNLHTLILKDGNVYSTGDNTLGRLGLWKSHGKTEGRILFGAGYEDKIAFVTCGPDHSIAVSQDGYSLYAWGSCDKVGVGHPAKSQAQAMEEAKSHAHDRALDHMDGGDGVEMSDVQMDVEPYIEKPFRFTCWNYEPKFPHRIVQVSCGAQHTIALREDGWVYTWSD